MQHILRLECLLLLPLLVRRAVELDQLWKQQADIAPFVHDGCTTERARDLGGHFILASLLSGRVEGQIAGALVEPDIFFMEDDTPLEGRPMHDLTPATVAELGVQWFVSLQGICHLSALAMGAPLDLTEFIQVLNLVRRAVFPSFTVEGLFVTNVGECRRRQRVIYLEGADFGHDQMIGEEKRVE